MHTRLSRHLIAPTLICVFIVLLGLGTQSEDRVVEILVTALTADGKPAEGLCIIVTSPQTRDAAQLGYANESGKCSIPVLVNDGDGSAFLFASPLGSVFTLDSDPAKAARKAIYEEHCWPVIQRVPVPAKSKDVEVVFRAAEAVLARGKIVYPGEAKNVAVLQPGAVNLIEGVRADGTFEVRVPKAKPGLLCFQFGKMGEGWCKVVELTESSTADNVDLGAIALSEGVSSAKVRLVRNGPDTPAPSDSRLGAGITLVSDDGQIVLNYSLDRGPTVCVDGTTKQGAGIPPGGYFVAPVGLVMGGGEKLVRLLRSGRKAELEAAAFPHFVAVEGELTEFKWSTGTSWDVLQKLAPD